MSYGIKGSLLAAAVGCFGLALVAMQEQAASSAPPQGLSHLPRAPLTTSTSASPKRWYLYVTDLGSNQVEVFNSQYQLVRTISQGLNVPVGDLIDRKGNLYVANTPGNYCSGGNVQEYAPGATSPTFTYSAGLSCPLAVATDEKGHVYIYDGLSYVNVFERGRNEVKRQFKLPKPPKHTRFYTAADLITDSDGNLFVEVGALYDPPHDPFPSSYTALYEYPLGRGPAQYLNIVGGAGMAFDGEGNLLVGDPSGEHVECSGAISIYPPPYTGSSSGYVTPNALCSPINLALTPDSATVFVSNAPFSGPNSNVLVYAYPSWTLVTTLGTQNGLIGPSGVAVGLHP